MAAPRSTNEVKIAWLMEHEQVWKKAEDTQEMLLVVAHGFVSAGLVAKAQYVSDTSTLKLIEKAAKRLRKEAAHA